jgi:hypothetical protein
VQGDISRADLVQFSRRHNVTVIDLNSEEDVAPAADGNGDGYAVEPNAGASREAAHRQRCAPIGLVGPMSNYAAPPQLVDDVPYCDMAAMPDFARQWRDEHQGQWFTAPKLSGFCLLIKWAVYDKIGGLDEQFGLGFFDDDDLCERARREGLSWLWPTICSSIISVAGPLPGMASMRGNCSIRTRGGSRISGGWRERTGGRLRCGRGRPYPDLTPRPTKGSMKVEKKISRKDAKAQRTQMGPGRRQAASYMGACGPIGVFRNSLPPSPPSQRLLCGLA